MIGMRKFVRFFYVLSLSLSLSLILPLTLCGCPKKSGGTARVVHIAIQPSAAFIPLYVARYNHFIEDALLPMGVSVVWQDFESGPPMNASLAAEMSDIGVIGDVPTVSALSGAVPMKLVGIPASGPDAYAMLARPDDASFRSSADMKGKRIATVFGSTGHNLTMKLLQKNGLSFEDIEFISIAAGDAENALSSGLADAVVIWEPNVTRLIDGGRAKIVALGSETDLQGTNGFVVRAEYLVSQREVISTILEQYQRAVELVPALDEATLIKLAGALTLTPSQVQKIAEKYDYSVVIADQDVEALQDTVRFFVSIGNLASPYPVGAKTDRTIYSAQK